MRILNHTELILTPEGCVYHLNLRPEHLADTIILVGDPDRVPMISAFFDEVEYKRQNREIVTHTGYFNNMRFTVISSGMGPDNIDIVLNEIDALANIDLDTRKAKSLIKSLNIIRLGTSGAIQEDMEVDRYVISDYALGMDGLMHFYEGTHAIIDKDLTRKFLDHFKPSPQLPTPYIIPGSSELSSRFSNEWYKGITVTAPGFYGPQGRSLRLELAMPDLIKKLNTFRAGNLRLLTFEMVSSAIYGLSRLMGHECLTICPVVASRVSDEYSKNYKVVMDNLIYEVLVKLSE